VDPIGHQRTRHGKRVRVLELNQIWQVHVAVFRIMNGTNTQALIEKALEVANRGCFQSKSAENRVQSHPEVRTLPGITGSQTTEALTKKMAHSKKFSMPDRGRDNKF
jgi:hypothetical protein